MRRRIELEIFFATGIIIILNTFVLANLHAVQVVSVFTIFFPIIRTLALYTALFLTGVILLLLGQKKWLWWLFILIISLMTFHVIQNLYMLIIIPNIQDKPVEIITDALLIWGSNVLVFALWYWFVDGGGPLKRLNPGNRSKIDLFFPQYQTMISGWELWRPRFLDYFFLSFFTSTSFAPADTLPLSKRVKLLMVSQASISLVIIGMVVSRAISLLQ